jgi:hypothetical protein
MPRMKHTRESFIIGNTIIAAARNTADAFEPSEGQPPLTATEGFTDRLVSQVANNCSKTELRNLLEIVEASLRRHTHA